MTVRRQRQQRRKQWSIIDSLSPLALETDHEELKVNMLQVFSSDDEQDIAISFCTKVGSINTIMPRALAAELITNLSVAMKGQ
jgi:hypothetical protein